MVDEGAWVPGSWCHERQSLAASSESRCSNTIMDENRVTDLPSIELILSVFTFTLLFFGILAHYLPT